MNAQSTTAGTAVVHLPNGGFAIDGDLMANTPEDGVGDWIPGPSGSGGYVLQSNGTPVNSGTTGFYKDPYASNSDNSFTKGSKAGDDPNTWKWAFSSTTGKGDINNAMYHLAKGINGDEWIIVAADRDANTGDAYIDFGFYQNTIITNSDGTFSSDGPDGGRTLNDILITVQFVNGGALANVYFYIWENTGTASSPVYEFVLKGEDEVEAYAAVNMSPTAVPFGAFGSTTYGEKQFAESAVNITKMFGDFNPCLDVKIKTLLIKTKNANSTTASLNDYVEPIQAQLQFGTATINYADASPICEGDATASVTHTGIDGGTYSSSSSDLIINSSTGEINVASSKVGTYTVYYDFTTNGCPKQVETEVTIYPKPGAPEFSVTQPVCGDTNGILTITNYNNTLTYTLTNTADNSEQDLPDASNEVAPGTYILNASTGNCNTDASSNVVINDAPIVPEAPTGDAAQTFCAIDNPTVSDLVAGGSNIKWYSTIDATSPLAENEALVNGEDYYATQTGTDCESADRLKVVVIVNDPAAPTGDATQTFCAIDTPTIAELSVSGSNIKWYAEENSTTILSSTEALVNGEDYYATQTVDGCESDTRLMLTVTINDPAAPTGDAAQTFCAIDTPTIAELSVSGSNIKWYAEENSITVLSSTEALVNGQDYYATQTVDGCESDTRLMVTVTVNDPAAPTGDAAQTFCAIDTPTIAELSVSGSNIKWYAEENSTTVLSSTEALVNGEDYYATQSVDGCESDTRLMVAVTINDPAAPTGDATQTFCFDAGSTIADLSANGQNIQWYADANTTSPLSSATSLVNGDNYFATQTVDGCESDTRFEVTVEILPEITLSATANSVTCNGEKDGMITVENDSYSTVQIFNSSNTDVTSSNGSLPAGIYKVVATTSSDITGTSCSKELTIEIKVRDNNNPVITVPGSLDIEICNASEITAENARFPLNTTGSANIIDSFTASGYSASDDQTVESITYTDVVNNDGCMPVVTRTFYAKDNCGAESSASMTINLLDNTKPYFNETLPGQEITVECSDIPDAPTFTATDSCTGNVDVSFTEDKADNGDGCGNTFTITRTWSAEDCSGNMVSFTQRINVVDTTAPVFDQELPEADINASCDGVPTAMELTATDACEGFVDVIYNETKQDDDECATNYTLVRTWTATDCAGNEASFTQNVHVTDTEKPVFVETLPAAEITVECDNVPETAVLTATDNCSTEVTVNYSEEFAGQDDDCANTYTITRTWIAADCAGNETTFVQTVNVVDTKAPEFNEAIPADMDMECENLPEPPTITASDNCDSNVEVVYEETSTKESPDDKEYVVSRTWTATDCAGNTTSASQKITIANTGAPSFNENLPGDITVECDAVPEAPVLTATDNCVDEATVSYNEVITGQDDGCSNEYTITRTWTASDDANNQTVHTQVITVVDTTAPEFDQELPAENLIVECDAVPVAMDLTATDNCSGSVAVDYSEAFSGKDDECANTYTITRTWTASDCAGNETTFVQTINVEDNTAPTFDGVLPSETVNAECDAVPVAMTLTASDNCSETVSVNYNEEISDKDSDADNNYTITRTWTAADCAGNETTFIQTVNVADTTAPEITSCPDSVEVSADPGVCSASGVELGMPTATDNCNAEVSITNDAPDEFPLGETTVTWTVSDNAGNTSTCTQVVTVIDDQAPEVETMKDITVNSDPGTCGAIVEFGMVGATDNCELESVEVTEGYTSGSEFPVGTTTVTWTVTDASGNTATSSFTVTVVDNITPEITCPGDMTVSTEEGQDYAIVNFADATATDNCDVSVEQTGGPASGSQFPIGTTVVTFTATDASGNTSECNFNVTVEDGEDPTISCPDNIETTVDGGICGAAVEFTTPEGMDNSGNVTVEQTGGPASGEIFPVGTTTVTFTATDEAGNTAECSFTVTVKDDEAPVIEQKDNITVNVDPDTCGAVVEFTAPEATDNCTVDSVLLTEGMDSGSEFPVGTTTVTYVATDNAGNTATSSFTVTVIDNIAPTIQCPGNIEVTVENGVTSVVVEYDAVTTTDNCDGTTVEMTSGIASGEEFPVGTTTITYTVTDAAGNTATCSFDVTVTEKELPPPPSAPETTVTQATCANPLGTITVTTVEGLTYSIDGENYQADSVFTDLAPGTYQVTAMDEYGQVSEVTTVTIDEPSAPVIETTTVDLCIDDSPFNMFELLLGEYDASGTWVDTENTGALDGNIVDPSQLAIGTYTFEYQLDGNCPSTTEVFVSINNDCIPLPCTVDDVRDSISKVVTPNGDNHNDYFTIGLNTDCDFTYDLMIFNRWGAKVFDAKNYQNNWDGFSEKSFTSSNQLPAGTYYYVLQIRNSEFEPIKGYIYLGTK